MCVKLNLYVDYSSKIDYFSSSYSDRYYRITISNEQTIDVSFFLSAFTLDAADEDIGKENIKNNTTEANTTDIIVLNRSEDKRQRYDIRPQNTFGNWMFSA